MVYSLYRSGLDGERKEVDLIDCVKYVRLSTECKANFIFDISTVACNLQRAFVLKDISALKNLSLKDRTAFINATMEKGVSYGLFVPTLISFLITVVDIMPQYKDAVDEEKLLYIFRNVEAFVTSGIGFYDPSAAAEILAGDAYETIGVDNIKYDWHMQFSDAYMFVFDQWVIDEYNKLPLEDIEINTVEQFFEYVDEAQSIRPEFQYSEDILPKSGYASALLANDYDVVICAPDGSGKRDFNANCVLADSRWVSKFETRPKILLTSDVRLLAKAKISIVLCPDYSVFCARLRNAGYVPCVEWYNQFLEARAVATHPLDSNLNVTRALFRLRSRLKDQGRIRKVENFGE